MSGRGENAQVIQKGAHTAPAAPEVVRSSRPARAALGIRIAGNKWTLRALFWGGLLLAWQLFALEKGPFFLPTVPQTIRALGELVTGGYYLTILGSLRQMLAGFVLACSVGIPVGALMGRSRWVEDLLAPYISTLFITSKEAILPLIIIVVGTQFEYRVVVVAMYAFFFPVINTAAGVRNISPHLIETARSFCTARRRMFSQILLPAALPYIVAGARLGLGMALKGMIIAEIWVTVGTGGLLKNVVTQRRLDLYFALVVVIIVLAVTTNEVLRKLEQRFQPWQKATR